MAAFEAGFLESMSAALKFRREIQFGSLDSSGSRSQRDFVRSQYAKFLHSDTGTGTSSSRVVDAELILELIDAMSKYEHFLPDLTPSSSSSHDSSAATWAKVSTQKKGVWTSVLQARSSMSHATTFVCVPTGSRRKHHLEQLAVSSTSAHGASVLSGGAAEMESVADANKSDDVLLPAAAIASFITRDTDVVDLEDGEDPDQNDDGIDDIAGGLSSSSDRGTKAFLARRQSRTYYPSFSS